MVKRRKLYSKVFQTDVHYINIHNKSDHDQEFEIHSWNGNKNITVKPYATAVLHAEDKTTGAIIALHEGHEGEQAEITKDGFGEIDAIKDHPDLDKLVRTFADGKTYIGVGAWRGSPETKATTTSSAGHGDKDIIVTYNDGDATPDNPPHLAHRPLEKIQQIRQRGAILFLRQLLERHASAGANFDHPRKSVKLGAHATAFVALPESFKGRVQSGTHLPTTWAEFQISASNDHVAHGDISLEQSCDGAATITATDGSKKSNGFTHDILKDARAAAKVKRPDGSETLATTMGN
ncbi:hypothetical protein MMC34_003661 [Xylographa carneopallida]|nr:hypothetical protein [Xylographa carneopallida]